MKNKMYIQGIDPYYIADVGSGSLSGDKLSHEKSISDNLIGFECPKEQNYYFLLFENVSRFRKGDILNLGDQVSKSIILKVYHRTWWRLMCFQVGNKLNWNWLRSKSRISGNKAAIYLKVKRYDTNN